MRNRWLTPGQVLQEREVNALCDEIWEAWRRSERNASEGDTMSKKVIRAYVGYAETWEPCWNSGSAEPELGYFDAWKGSD